MPLLAGRSDDRQSPHAGRRACAPIMSRSPRRCRHALSLGRRDRASASTARASCNCRCAWPAATCCAIPTCRQRRSGSGSNVDGPFGPAPRRPRVLEGPCGDHDRPRNDDPRQRPHDAGFARAPSTSRSRASAISMAADRTIAGPRCRRGSISGVAIHDILQRFAPLEGRPSARASARRDAPGRTSPPHAA